MQHSRSSRVASSIRIRQLNVPLGGGIFRRGELVGGLMTTRHRHGHTTNHILVPCRWVRPFDSGGEAIGGKRG